MARWASLIKKRRSTNPVLLVDTGDFCQSHKTKLQKVTDQYFFEAMKLMGYDAIGIGDKDVRLGRKKLLKTAKSNRLPLVSSNIIDKQSHKLMGAPYIIKDIGGKRTLLGRKDAIRVGILSVVLPIYIYNIDKLATRYYEVANPKIAALDAVSKLREKGCNLIIALSHQGWGNSLDLAEDVPGIDIVINGHRSHAETYQKWVNNTLVIDTGEKRTTFTEISVTFEGDSLSITALDAGKEALLTNGHPKFVKLERDYEEDLRQYRLKKNPGGS